MSSTTGNDRLHRFSFTGYPVRGQWVRLNQVAAQANGVHNYPVPVRDFLSEMFAAVAMFADNLKFSGAVALQSQGDGALTRSLAECRDRKYLRGIVHLGEQTLPKDATFTDWLGKGRLALSLIPPPDSHQAPYQGLVALEHDDLAQNLEGYLTSSEQLPSRLFLASDDRGATGLLLQRLPSPDHATEIELEAANEAWHTIVTLAETVTEPELLLLPVEQLLQRLFNEYTCRLHPARELEYRCTCSRRKSDRTLRVLDDAEIEELLNEQGSIEIDCEFCGTRYNYDAVDVGALLGGATSQSEPRAPH